MSTPSTTNTALVFVSRVPAWEAGVTVKQGMATDIFIARSGLQQSQGRQARGAWEIEYEATLDRTTAVARQARALLEISAPLVVPFWTEPALSTTALTANAVTIDRTPDNDWFTAGEWIYVTDDAGVTGEFREIDSTAGSVLTLVAEPGSTDYLAGVTIYPCRFCTRATEGANFSAASEDSVTESLNYMTL